MAYTLWSQDVFTKGELSPYMYGRVTVNEYNFGLKTAQNVVTYPTGAAGKRFGTLYDSTLNFTDPLGFYFETFQYLNEAVYQLIFYANNIDIYLEGIFVANVSTSLNGYQVYNMSSTTIGALFRVAGIQFAPYDLSRSANSPITITGFGSNFLIASAASFTVGQVLPAQFANFGGALPITNPEIISGVTYFINALSTTHFEIFSSSINAKFRTNPFIVTSSGTGTNTLIIQNTWTFSHTAFTNLPFYDFNSALLSYDSLTFTPSAVAGSVTITVSGSGYTYLNSSYVGGAFFGNGGSGIITAVASATSFTVMTQVSFTNTDAIQGNLVLLAEPAWSDARGWPQICSSYQNRALFSNTASLPNGFWASVSNDYANFANFQNDDDEAISWFPTSNDINYIRFIVPYRSITVHTNSGIYSSPLSDVVAITPSNFTLQLQDSTPADTLQPQAIDNQVLVLSGNDAHQMLWDGINNAYTSNVVSIINEQTIRNPVDEESFADLRRAGSRFVFIINGNGSMAVFQTLLSENVRGITPQIMEQSYGSAQFLQVASSSEGRCWFVNQRQIAVAASPIAITGFTSNSLKAVASNFSTTVPTAITFTTSGVLPSASPDLTVSTYYWAIGIDADDFSVYLDQADALAGVNSIVFTNSGTSSDVIGWPLSTIFTLEELTEDTFLDCAVYYNGTAVSTLTTGVLFNAQNVAMVGDGFGFTAIGVSNEVVFEAHGSPQTISKAYVGFPINTIIEPMPLSIADGPSSKTSTLTKPKHIRSIRWMFNNTIGGEINGVPIALAPFNQANIGDPPFPERGIFEMMIMKGWDDFNFPSFTITHSDPFDIQLLGIYYSVDI